MDVYRSYVCPSQVCMYITIMHVGRVGIYVYINYVFMSWLFKSLCIESDVCMHIVIISVCIAFMYVCIVVLYVQMQ